MAKELNAIRSLFQKGGFDPDNLKKVARVLAIYHVLLPITFQYVSNLGGWDEEDKKEYLRAGLLGSINGVFIFGDLIDGIIRAVLGLRVWDTEIPIAQLFDDLGQALASLTEDDLTNEDVYDALADLASAGSAVGLPTEQIKNMMVGIGQILNENIKNGLLILMGWSQYTVESEKERKSEKKKSTKKRSPSGKPIRRIPSK